MLQTLKPAHGGNPGGGYIVSINKQLLTTMQGEEQASTTQGEERTLVMQGKD